MKRIVLTGGGTAGHVTPNLALIAALRKEGWEIHYIGTANGMERGLIEPLEGVTYHAVKSGKLRRYFDLKNFTDPFRVLAGAFHVSLRCAEDTAVMRRSRGAPGVTILGRSVMASDSSEKGEQTSLQAATCSV